MVAVFVTAVAVERLPSFSGLGSRGESGEPLPSESVMRMGSTRGGDNSTMSPSLSGGDRDRFQSERDQEREEREELELELDSERDRRPRR